MFLRDSCTRCWCKQVSGQMLNWFVIRPIEFFWGRGLHDIVEVYIEDCYDPRSLFRNSWIGGVDPGRSNAEIWWCRLKLKPYWGTIRNDVDENDLITTRVNTKYYAERIYVSQRVRDQMVNQYCMPTGCDYFRHAACTRTSNRLLRQCYHVLVLISTCLTYDVCRNIYTRE